MLLRNPGGGKKKGVRLSSHARKKKRKKNKAEEKENVWLSRKERRRNFPSTSVQGKEEMASIAHLSEVD